MNDRKHNNTIYALGECMVEFSCAGAEEYRRSFAGDVFNTAVYLNRLAPEGCAVEFVSAVGDDTISAAMLSAWREEGLFTKYVAILPGKAPGLYVIDTDDAGERCFSYWRSRSAARELTVSLKHIDGDVLQEGDYIYYSGITLAILNEERRSVLFDFVKKAKAKGVVIAFDPNFRPALWESHAAAAENTMKAYGLSDIVLTGADEEASLFGWGSEASELGELERIGVKEAILKAGERGVFGASNGERFHIPFNPAAKVVDTTAAGDSFAGAYLAFRLRGKTPAEATALSARVARIVVSSRGAIIARRELEAKMRQDPILSSELEYAN
ncbi:sugar kinase [Hyphococcus sp.]|uniref:sugar kinase n=1 Tax=Hyphococcus sp. TaxID=2038636 RepID=UPI003CCBE0F4